MDRIEIKAYGKVNLGLDVTGRREDGYHLVRMIMQTVDICDDVCIEKTALEADCPDRYRITVSCDHPQVPADERNLAYQAAEKICSGYGIRSAVHIDIRKRIPMAAGMAGGSADCAAVIRGMNCLFDLGMDLAQMDALAVSLGADVAFCLRKGTYLAEGIGEVLTRLPDLAHCHMVIIKPDFSVSTPWAYKALDREIERNAPAVIHPDIDSLMKGIREGSIAGIAEHMGNILEPVVCAQHPEISRIIRELEQNGACRAMMSGSGPVVFGIFTDESMAEKAVSDIGGVMENGKFKVEF